MSSQRKKLEAETSSEPSLFEKEAELFNARRELDYYTYEFINNLVDSEKQVDEARLLDSDQYDLLLLLPDGTEVFVGRDDTSRNAGIFGFTVTPGEPVPFVASVDEALNLLQPNEVAENVHSEDSRTPKRQGEWFFLESDEEPESRVYKGGVGRRPFNDSPLQNHVPRDFAFGAREEAVLERLGDTVPGLFESIEHVSDLVKALSDMHEWHWITRYIGREGEMTFQELCRDILDGVYVRGTVRHRSKDHDMLRLGEDWHLAITHRLNVESADPNQVYDTGHQFGYDRFD